MTPRHCGAYRHLREVKLYWKIHLRNDIGSWFLSLINFTVHLPYEFFTDCSHTSGRRWQINSFRLLPWERQTASYAESVVYFRSQRYFKTNFVLDMLYLLFIMSSLYWFHGPAFLRWCNTPDKHWVAPPELQTAFFEDAEGKKIQYSI